MYACFHINCISHEQGKPSPHGELGTCTAGLVLPEWCILGIATCENAVAEHAVQPHWSKSNTNLLQHRTA